MYYILLYIYLYIKTVRANLYERGGASGRLTKKTGLGCLQSKEAIRTMSVAL